MDNNIILISTSPNYLSDSVCYFPIDFVTLNGEYSASGEHIFNLVASH